MQTWQPAVRPAVERDHRCAATVFTVAGILVFLLAVLCALGVLTPA